MNAPQRSKGTPDLAEWKPLLEVAVHEVFGMMLDTEARAASAAPAPTKERFTSMVGMAGHICGVLSLSCNRQAAALFAAKMLRVSPQEADGEMFDAVGELCNMIAGNFKSKLVELSEHCLLSVPTVITGGDYDFHAVSTGERLEVLMECEGEFVRLELDVRR
jgi:chemotaxis protein CheX